MGGSPVVWTKVQKTAGAAIRATKIELAHLDRVDIGTQDDQQASGSLLYDGVVISQYECFRHTNSWIVGGTHNGVTLSGNSANTFGVAISRISTRGSRAGVTASQSRAARTRTSTPTSS